MRYDELIADLRERQCEASCNNGDYDLISRAADALAEADAFNDVPVTAPAPTRERCPISGAIEYIQWVNRNCVRCAKHNEHEAPTCPIDEALQLVQIGGDWPEGMTERMGTEGVACPEREGGAG